MRRPEFVKTTITARGHTWTIIRHRKAVSKNKQFADKRLPKPLIPFGQVSPTHTLIEKPRRVLTQDPNKRLLTPTLGRFPKHSGYQCLTKPMTLISGCDVKRIYLTVTRQVTQSIRPAAAKTNNPGIGTLNHEYTFSTKNQATPTSPFTGRRHIQKNTIRQNTGIGIAPCIHMNAGDRSCVVGHRAAYVQPTRLCKIAT